VDQFPRACLDSVNAWRKRKFKSLTMQGGADNIVVHLLLVVCFVFVNLYVLIKVNSFYVDKNIIILLVATQHLCGCTGYHQTRVS